MDRTERFYVIDKLLQQRRSTSMNLMIEKLEVSKATIKRDLAYMRDRMYAPIIWDPDLQGYRYEEPEPGYPRFSLPGLWFNESELFALLTMDHLLENIQPGLLSSHVEPLRNRIRKILQFGDYAVEDLLHRVRIVPAMNPPVETSILQKVTSAVLFRQQISAQYLSRSTGDSSFRHISPQRVVYYNRMWYLDGWCHLREGLRTFRLWNLAEVTVTDFDAVEIDEETLDSELKSGFGIFVGQATQKAVLRFDETTSRWVEHEHWHSSQESKLDDNDRLILSVPYSNDTELMRHILSYGSAVEVLEPQSLREKVASKLRDTLETYEQK